jgi:signal transduction histidine kinase
MLDDLGLAAALEWHVNEWSKRTHIKTKVNLPEEEWELDPSLNTGLYRVCQEALTNVVRHAGASKVQVLLAREGDEVVLTVRDNGRGMDGGKITAPESVGLLGMKERVEQIGGRLEVQSEAGKGTTVVARVQVSEFPLPQPSQPSPKERGHARTIPKGKGSR